MASSSFDPSVALKGLEAISGKWKLRIIGYLLGGTKRFNELHVLLSGISWGTLTFELRQLQRDGIIHRTQYSTIPPTVIRRFVWTLKMRVCCSSKDPLQSILMDYRGSAFLIGVLELSQFAPTGELIHMSGLLPPQFAHALLWFCC
jgi:hypothetical protein